MWLSEEHQQRHLDDEQQVRNGSADSGQSSPPDTGSSDGSIADSLETEQPARLQASVKSHTNNNDGDVSSIRRRDEEDALTIRNYLEAANNKLAANNNNNNNNELNKVTTPIGHEAEQETTASGLTADTQQQHLIATNQQPLKSALSQPGNLNGNNRFDSATSQIQRNNFDNQQHEQQPELEEHPKQQQSQNAQAKSSSNNYSGLNLNMTASEMRELIARRKKFDPKKAQMNIRQKYEIIQQM